MIVDGQAAIEHRAEGITSRTIAKAGDGLWICAPGKVTEYLKLSPERLGVVHIYPVFSGLFEEMQLPGVAEQIASVQE